MFGISGITGSKGQVTTNMLMTNYRYVYAFGFDRDPGGYRSYFKFSKLTLNGNNISEEVISELEEYNVLGVTYSLSGGYIRVFFWNGTGYALLFGFK